MRTLLFVFLAGISQALSDYMKYKGIPQWFDEHLQSTGGIGVLLVMSLILCIWQDVKEILR